VLALALAIASPEIELLALTVVGRQSIYRSQIAERYIKLAQKEIPVFFGCDTPLNISGFNWKGNEGLGIFSETKKETAVEAIIRLFESSDDIELVAIGPLTNIAKALMLAPHIVKNIRKLWIMGGHLGEIKYEGKVFPYGIDYNLRSDPEASLRVLKSHIKEIILITANVTLSTWMNQHDLASLEKLDSDFIQAIVRDLKIWIPLQREYLEKHSTLKDKSDNVAFLHDPLVIGCVIDESFCIIEELPIEPVIILKEDDKKTQIFRTIAHREHIDNVTVRMKCAMSVDAKRFQKFMMDRLVQYFQSTKP